MVGGPLALQHFNLIKKGNEMTDKQHEILFRKFENDEANITKPKTKQVKFNIAVADYRPGQIVNYFDMPVGHRHWVDTKGIMETTRICEFVDDPELEIKPKSKDEKNLKISDSISKPLCPGKNKDGGPCKRNKVQTNGYCHHHQDQAPTGLSGEIPENMKDFQGLTA